LEYSVSVRPDKPDLAIVRYGRIAEHRLAGYFVACLLPIDPVRRIPRVVVVLPVNYPAADQPYLTVKREGRWIASLGPGAAFGNSAPLHSVARIPNVIVVPGAVKPSYQPYLPCKDRRPVKHSGG